MCKVSILIPTHEGRDKFVIKILQKLSLQTYSNFKVIIADNDYLKKEVPSYIKDFNFEIEYIINKKNLGPQKNVMNLISLVKTDFFKFIFSDDLISEDFLEKCVSILDENTDYSAVFTKRIFIDENGKYTGDANFYDFDESKKLLVQNLFEETCEKLDWFPGEMTNFIFRKKEYVFSELFTPKFGTQKSFICSYDLVLFLNLLKKDDNVYFINEPLCMIRNHDDRYLLQYDSKVTCRLDYFYFILECYVREYINKELFEKKSFQLLNESFIFINNYKDLTIESLSYIKLFIKNFSKILCEKNKEMNLPLSSISFFMNSLLNREIFKKVRCEKIIVYGAGEYSRQFFNDNEFVQKVYCFMDDNYENRRLLDKPINKLSKVNDACYFISTFSMERDMYQKLLEKGIEESAIFFL